jgi:hypothetical protein
MQNTFENKVRSAAVAGWQVIVAIWFILTLSWLLYLAVASARPAWLLSLWGPDVTWSYIQNVWIWALVIVKVGAWLLVLVVLWLTLWARQLRKQSAGA